MKFSKLLLFTAMVLVLSVAGINAQGRGGGGNRGGGGGMGGSMGGGRPTTSPGIDRGIDMSSDRSMGRSDKGRSTASDRSNGRSDNGMNTARSAGNAPSDRELPKFNGISKKLGTTPADLRTAYQAALAANPDLKFGEFVSANVVASNLNKRFPNVTTSAILLGLQNDRSLGQTLRDLGVGSDAAKTAMKNAKEEIRDSEDH
jgi:hypothetical protein